MGEIGRLKKSPGFRKIFFWKPNTPSRNRSKNLTSDSILNTKSALLPQEIHDYILQSLCHLHKDRRYPTCSTCLSRDLSSYSLVCKNWHKAAIPHMYKNISINGPEAPVHNKGSKRGQKETSRSAKLLRTLTARPDYAAHIREIKLPQFNRESSPRAKVHEYLELTASIIKRCPNLEKALGLYTSCGGWCNSLNKALATRSSLREQVFMFEDHIDEHLDKVPEFERSSQFTELFGQWSRLETLVLYGANKAPGVDFIGAFTRLPKLKRLMMSKFKFGASNSPILEAIPASVEDLRLEGISGIGDSAMVAFAKSRCATDIHSISLINIKIGRLRTLESLFQIPNVRRFTLADNEDTVFFDDAESIMEDNHRLPAIFSSINLRYLHWDVICSATVERSLAEAISSGLLPSLRLLRAPSDKSGILQAVCQPLEEIVLPGDFVFEATLSQAPPLPPTRMATIPHFSPLPLVGFANSAPQSRRASTSSRRGSVSSYRSATFPSISSNQSSTGTGNASTTVAAPITPLKSLSKAAASQIHPFPRTLPLARLRAQKRIDRARQDIKLQIVIEDTDMKTKETFSLRGYIGDVQSKVVYSLQPDIKTIESAKHGDALVRFRRDVLDREWRRECIVTPEGTNAVCAGEWNIRNVIGGKGKEKHIGLHTERRRVEFGAVTIHDLFM